MYRCINETPNPGRPGIVQSFVLALLVKNPEKRLGGGPDDGKEVMGHEFFAGMDFERLGRKELPPPFVPQVSSDTDTANFDPYFTSEAPQLTPPGGGGGLADAAGKFAGFESVAK